MDISKLMVDYARLTAVIKAKEDIADAPELSNENALGGPQDRVVPTLLHVGQITVASGGQSVTVPILPLPGGATRVHGPKEDGPRGAGTDQQSTITTSPLDISGSEAKDLNDGLPSPALGKHTSVGPRVKPVRSMPCWNALRRRFEAPVLDFDTDCGPESAILGLDDKLEPAWFYDVSEMPFDQLKLNLDRFFSGPGRVHLHAAIVIGLADSYDTGRWCTDQCKGSNGRRSSPYFYTTICFLPPEAAQLNRHRELHWSTSIVSASHSRQMVLSAVQEVESIIRLDQVKGRIRESPLPIPDLFWTMPPVKGAGSSTAGRPPLEDLSDSWMNNSDVEVPKMTRKNNKKKKSKGKGKQGKPVVPASRYHPSTYDEASVQDDGSMHADDELDTAHLLRSITPSAGAPEAERHTRLPVVGRMQTCSCEECMTPPARYARLDDTDLEDD